MMDRSGNVEDALPPGTRIEEFEIERALPSGDFGVTYLAQDRSLGRRVAIKEYLPREWGGRRSDGSVGPRSSSHAKDYRWGLARFLEEARTLARLDHPRIVRVHRVIEAWGTAYMVMEYVEGRNLEEALQAEGPWPEARVRTLLEELLPGLVLVHAAGLIHRDIKPANVMLRSDGTPVLIDFGSARYAAIAHSDSLTSVLTPRYAPFEQYQTGGKQGAWKQGAWTDVYALGAVAYRALSGRAPAEAPRRLEAAARRQPDPLVPVSEAAAGGVSESFGAAVTSALAVFSDGRPRDVAAWRAQWDAAEDGGATGEDEAGKDDGGRSGSLAHAGSRRPWIRRAARPVAYGAAALVVVAGLAFGILTVFSYERELLFDDAFSAAIESAGDEDTYRITVSSPGRLTVHTTGVTDTFGELLDASGNVLGSDDDGGSDTNFRLTWPVSPGTYYVRVRHFADDGTGDYAVIARLAAP